MTFKAKVTNSYYTPARTNCSNEDAHPAEFEYEYEIEELYAEVFSYDEPAVLILDDAHEIEIPLAQKFQLIGKAFYATNDGITSVSSWAVIQLEPNKELEDLIAEVIREHHTN